MCEVLLNAWYYSLATPGVLLDNELFEALVGLIDGFWDLMVFYGCFDVLGPN